MLCAKLFNIQSGISMLSIEDVIKQAQIYIERIHHSVELEGTDELLRKIRSTNSVKQSRDHLAAFVLASLLGDATRKLVFEEPCTKHPSGGPHDLVAYLNDGTRLVNEIKRLAQTPWDKYEEENYMFGQATEQLYELKEDPHHSTTGFLDIILREIESKSKQLDPKETNIVWFTSNGIHYQATDIEDAASHYALGWHKLSEEQPGKAHSKPENLSALGWFWDGDPEHTTAKAQCFFITPLDNMDILGSEIIVKKLKGI